MIGKDQVREPEWDILLSHTNAIRKLDNAEDRRIAERDRQRSTEDPKPNMLRLILYAQTLLEAGIIRLLAGAHPTRDGLSSLASDLYPDWVRMINLGKTALFHSLLTACYLDTKEENRASIEGFPGLVVATGLILRRLNLDLWALRPDLAAFCENRELLEEIGIW